MLAISAEEDDSVQIQGQSTQTTRNSRSVWTTESDPVSNPHGAGLEVQGREKQTNKPTKDLRQLNAVNSGL